MRRGGGEAAADIGCPVYGIQTGLRLDAPCPVEEVMPQREAELTAKGRRQFVCLIVAAFPQVGGMLRHGQYVIRGQGSRGKGVQMTGQQTAQRPGQREFSREFETQQTVTQCALIQTIDPYLVPGGGSVRQCPQGALGTSGASAAGRGSPQRGQAAPR